MNRLPASVQEIADVIGRERALYLIGRLPRCYVADKRKREANKGGFSERVMLYVPKSLRPDHPLVQILGWPDAQRMVQAFGGEVLAPANCKHLVAGFRDAHIERLSREGLPLKLLADWFGVSERLVSNIAKAAVGENPQVGTGPHANDNRAHSTHRTAAG